MAAYLVFTRDKTLDAAELALYWEQIGPTFAGHEVKVLANYGPFEDLEGAATEGTVIAEFPSMEAAKAWYFSPPTRPYACIGKRARSIAACSSRAFSGHLYRINLDSES